MRRFAVWFGGVGLAASLGGWGASMTGDIHVVTGHILEVVGVTTSVAVSLWAIWPWLKVWRWVATSGSALALLVALLVKVQLGGYQLSAVRYSLGACAVLTTAFIVEAFRNRRSVQTPTDLRSPFSPQATDALAAPGVSILTKSRREIEDEIASRPLAQQAEAARHYAGLRVEWEGTLVNIIPGWGVPARGKVSLSLRCGGRLLSDTIAEVTDSPEISLLHQNDLIRIVGIISRVRIDGVFLNPAQVVSVIKRANS